VLEENGGFLMGEIGTDENFGDKRGAIDRESTVLLFGYFW
jgi:hypothetical protein